LLFVRSIYKVRQRSCVALTICSVRHRIADLLGGTAVWEGPAWQRALSFLSLVHLASGCCVVLLLCRLSSVNKSA
jgi:hypothetical protein